MTTPCGFSIAMTVSPASNRGANPCCGIVAIKIYDIRQIADVTRRVDRGHANIADSEPRNLDVVSLAFENKRSRSPGKTAILPPVKFSLLTGELPPCALAAIGTAEVIATMAIRIECFVMTPLNKLFVSK
jgi:hypothetical protein